MKRKLPSIEFQLKRPFEPHKVKWRKAFGKGQQGKMLCYIDARDVMQRLDEVVGVHGWQRKYPQLGICELSLFINGIWITKSDVADETNIEALKGQSSDAFKRAAASFGLGRYLYAIKGNELPHWATPEGFDEIFEEVK